MSINSRNRCSMMKHSGALMSSRLIPPKRWTEVAHAIDEFLDIPGVNLDIDSVYVREALEEAGFALHYGFGRERAKIAEPQHRRAVADHGDDIGRGPCSRTRRQDSSRFRGKARPRLASRRASDPVGWSAVLWA